MTQSVVPLLEANLTFSRKPGEVELMRQQKAGGRDWAGCRGWRSAAGAQGKECGRAGGRGGQNTAAAARGQSDCPAPAAVNQAGFSDWP